MKSSLLFIFLSLLIAPFSINAQDNGFLEKTRIQHKLSEARHNYLELNIKSALINYKEALALDAGNPKAEYGLAKCNYKLQDYKKAKFYIEKAFQSDPEVDDDIHYLMGQIYFRLNELEKAEKNFNSFKEGTKSKSRLEDYDIELKLKQVAYAKKALSNANSNVNISNMGAILNTSAPEYAPSISNDGNYLIFTSRRADTKGGGVDHYYDHRYFSDIYLSKWDVNTKTWSEPTNYIGKINTEYHDGSLGFTPDNSILVYRNIFNVTKSGDIYQAARTKSGDWASPKPILHRDKAISNKINSSYFESSASMTSDESYIYFVSERPSGQGQTDIYYVKKTGKSYSEPVNLGDKINTAGDEKCVFIHPTGKLLFFTSNGRSESIGSYDIYYCTGGPENWSEPINFGAPINTTLEEKTINVSIDGKTAYIGGYYDIDNQGDADLYKIDISSFNFLSE